MFEEATVVALTGIRARGHHGVYASERRNGQIFVVDVSCVVARQTDAPDDVRSTIDYGALAQQVVADIQGEPVDLIETLADRIAATCLAHDLAREVMVTVRKPEVQLSVPVDSFAVSVTRKKQDERPGKPVARTDRRQRIHKVVFSLGSNVGDRKRQLQQALQALARIPETALISASSVYETEPVGLTDQPAFLNMVVLGASALTPRVLLDRCRDIESTQGRDRSGPRWGPRTMDIDLICAGSYRLDSADLILPHPRAHERAFVLVPWAEVDPLAVLPGHGKVIDLAAGVGAAGVTKREDLVIELP